jgi:hypothetical protein
MIVLLKIMAGVLLTNLYEWLIHKHLLHGLGKNKNSIWSFHWHDHHKNVRRTNGFDLIYLQGFYGFEAIGIGVLFMIHVPILWSQPIILTSMAIYGMMYYYLHKYAHLNPAWGKKHMRWHWDHHMGRNQDANWCVLFPLADYVFGTREKQ